MPHHESNVRICTTTSQCPSLPYPITLFNADSASAECSATTIGSQPDDCRFLFWTIRGANPTLTQRQAPCPRSRSRRNPPQHQRSRNLTCRAHALRNCIVLRENVCRQRNGGRHQNGPARRQRRE